MDYGLKSNMVCFYKFWMSNILVKAFTDCCICIKKFQILLKASYTTSKITLHILIATGLVAYDFCIQGACIFVAVMLQYFFTSAFCWMLCEGVILYLMLVIVFSSRFNNRLFFFALGWGMNTIV